MYNRRMQKGKKHVNSNATKIITYIATYMGKMQSAIKKQHPHPILFIAKHC